nr:MAG TPA: Thymidylate synthase complementing protein [Crassvirales sp.]
MKLCKPLFEIWEQSAGLEGVYKQIERVGRVCYKSEDKITEDSAKPFVDRMIKSGHGAMLEHGTVYLKVINKGLSLCNYEKDHIEDKYINNPYSKVVFGKYPKYNSYEEKLKATQEVYITTNYRVLVENGWLDDLQYICEPTEYHERRITVHFVCDRGVSHEFVRHRVMSFAQESTRYCNYSKDKFGNELTFIKPCWLDIPTGQYIYWDGDWCDINKMKIQLPEGEHKDIDAFLWTLNNAETHYTLLINSGWKPQEARAVLPNSLKTELVVTGFTSDWNHFFDLRARGTTGAPHPQAKELAEPLMKEFIARNYIDN